MFTPGAMTDCMGERASILIVEDEPDLADLLSFHLQREGYQCRRVGDGDRALAEAQRQPPDLVLLDRMLPGVAGDEVARRMKRDTRTADVPIIMLTAKATDEDELVGFALGADDYVRKPFSVKLLLARVARGAAAGTGAGRARSAHGRPRWFWTTAATKPASRGARLDLTATEFRILAALMAARGRVLSREQLIDTALGRGAAGNESRDGRTHRGPAEEARRRRRLGPHDSRCRVCFSPAGRGAAGDVIRGDRRLGHGDPQQRMAISRGGGTHYVLAMDRGGSRCWPRDQARRQNDEVAAEVLADARILAAALAMDWPLHAHSVGELAQGARREPEPARRRRCARRAAGGSGRWSAAGRTPGYSGSVAVPAAGTWVGHQSAARSKLAARSFLVAAVRLVGADGTTQGLVWLARPEWTFGRHPRRLGATPGDWRRPGDPGAAGGRARLRADCAAACCTR